MSFKLSLPGKDINSSRSTDQAVSELYPSPKIDVITKPPHAGSIAVDWRSSLTIPDGTTKLIYSFPHGYNYVPTVIAAFEFDNGSTKANGVLPFQYGSLGLILIDSDTNNINLKYYSIDGGVAVIPPFTMNVRFYVMAERGLE